MVVTPTAADTFAAMMFDPTWAAGIAGTAAGFAIGCTEVIR